MTPDRFVRSLLRVETVALSRGALQKWGTMGFSAVLNVSGVDLATIHSPVQLHGYSVLDGSGFDDFPLLEPGVDFRAAVGLGQRRALMRTVRMCLQAVGSGTPTLVVDRPGASRGVVVAAGALVHLLGGNAEQAVTSVGGAGTPVQHAAVGWVQEQQR